MRSLRVAAFAVLLACMGTAVTACGYNGLNFVQDERVEITAPLDRAKVSLPLTVSWSVRDFEVTGRQREARPDAGYFGVYVDRAPQPPGTTQDSLVRDDPSCRSNPNCPDADFLAQRDIHATEEMTFVIERLPQPSSEAQRRREFHEVTIVLLDGRGRRIGESAFVRQFEVDRDTS